MKTTVMTTETIEKQEAAINEAARLIKAGQIVAIPTETVYGLGANALNEDAVKSIFIAKGRPQDNPLIVHISDISMLDGLVRERGFIRDRLADVFWPGPLTIIFPKSDAVSNVVTAGLDTVAIRMPSHPIARAIIDVSGVPVAAPSANSSGKPSTTSAQHVLDDMDGKIPLIIDGGRSEVGVESTVVTVKDNTVTVLRPGGITPEMLKNAVPDAEIKIADAVLKPLKENEAAPSPGMKHKHYSPSAKVILCRGSDDKIVGFANTFAEKNTVLIADEALCSMTVIDTYPCGTTLSDEAHDIFDLMRRADKEGYERIILKMSDENGIGLAVNNRVLRAAGFEVKEL